MIFIVAILAFGLVAEAAIFVWYINRSDIRHNNTVFQLLNREAPTEQKPFVLPLPEAVKNDNDEDEQPSDAEKYEWEAVGQIDPYLERDD